MAKVRVHLADLGWADRASRSELTMTELQLILGYLESIEDADPALKHIIATLEEIIDNN